LQKIIKNYNCRSCKIYKFPIIFCQVCSIRRQKNSQKKEDLFMPRRGENIYKRKDGRWEARYIKGYVNSKTKYGYVYAKTYKEVKEKLSSVFVPAAEAVDGMKDITIMKQQYNISFKEVALAWLETIKPQLKKSSIVKYTNILVTYIFPHFGEDVIQTITRENIIDFSNTLLFSGGQKGEGLSPKTVNSVISVLKSIFEYAKQHENIEVASIRNLSVRQPQKPMRIFSLDEQQKLAGFLSENLTLVNLGILLCMYTGIRLGEVCALKWEDIHFNEQYLHISKTMQRIQNKESNEQKTSIMISEPKSECSIRNIPLPDRLFQMIVSVKCPGNTYFLTGLTTAFIEPRTLQNRFKSIIKTCDIKDANFHSLRHTFATRCIEVGFDVKSLSEILGHASVNITMNRYVHPSMELKQRNMNMLSDLFSVK